VIDERRSDFTSTLWDIDPRIIQALFPGCHSDVGGGYPETGNESGLYDNTFMWLSGALASRDVQFAAAPTYISRPFAIGPSHSPWLHDVWMVMAQCPRTFRAGLLLAKFTLDMINGGPVGSRRDRHPYLPANLSVYLNGNQAANGVAVV
jgi:hypothetical protein